MHPLLFFTFSPYLFHSTKPIWDTHGCSQQPSNPMLPPPPMVHSNVASPLLKCLSLFSCSPKPNRGQASLCNHHLQVAAITSIQPTVSLAGFVNSISEPLLPNAPLSIIIIRKKKMSFYFLFFQFLMLTVLYVWFFCVYFAFGMVSPFTRELFSFI